MAARAAASLAGDIRKWEGSIVQRGGVEWPTGASPLLETGDTLLAGRPVGVRPGRRENLAANSLF